MENVAEGVAVEASDETAAAVERGLEQLGSGETTELDLNTLPQETEEAAEPTPDLSSQFAELKRREKALRAERVKMKRELESEREQWMANLRANPLTHLQELGITTQQLANALLEDPMDEAPAKAAPTVDPQLQKEIEELKAYKQQQIVAEFRKEVFAPVEASPEDYELILNSKNGRDLYWNAVADYYQSYGETPDYVEMAKEVENALLEEAKGLLALRKLQPPKPVEEPKVEAKKEVAEAAVEPQADDLSEYKTLSNRMTADSFGNRVKVTRSTGGSKPATADYYRAMEEQKQAIINKFLK